MTRFVVDLGDAKLSEHKKNAITAGIQALVIRELADVDFGTPHHVGVIPPGWLGFVIRPNLAAIESANGEIATFAGTQQAGA
jgi:hypothetical protein